jgi:hypothetical protein
MTYQTHQTYSTFSKAIEVRRFQEQSPLSRSIDALAGNPAAIDEVSPLEQRSVSDIDDGPARCCRGV